MKTGGSFLKKEPPVFISVNLYPIRRHVSIGNAVLGACFPAATNPLRKFLA